MALSTRDRRALVAGAVGLAVLGVHFLGIEPAARAYGRLSDEHDRLAAQLARTRQNQAKAAYYRQRIADCEKDAGELRAPRPAAEQITAVAAALMTAAQQSGVQLRTVTPAAPSPWGDDPALVVALLQIDAEVAWPKADLAPQAWGNIFKFVRQAYRIPGVLSVERCDLGSELPPGPPNNPNVGGKINVRLTLSVLTAAVREDDAPWRG